MGDGEGYVFFFISVAEFYKISGSRGKTEKEKKVK
jgi:hypothetical protein